MFYGTYDRTVRADRYRKVAAEYTELSKRASDPHLGSYYLRIAEDYQDQAQRELRALERERVGAQANGKSSQAEATRGQRPSKEGEARGGPFAAGL
jgi:uncharacterized protein YdaU (DUF1376 family)